MPATKPPTACQREVGTFYGSRLAVPTDSSVTEVQRKGIIFRAKGDRAPQTGLATMKFSVSRRGNAFQFGFPLKKRLTDAFREPLPLSPELQKDSDP